MSYVVFGHAAPDDSYVIAHPTAPLSRADIVAEIADWSEGRLVQLRANQAFAENLARDLHLRRLVAERQRRDGIDRSATIAAKLRLQAERVLYEAYLEKAEARFPGEAVIERLARDEYKANPEKFQRGEELRIRHILIRSSRAFAAEARNLAESLLLRAKAGEPFEELATRYSDDPGSAEKGGDLGFVGRGKTVAEFEKAAFALKSPGDYAPVIETQFGFHVLRLEERRAPGLIPFDEVKAQLVDATRLKLKTQLRTDAVRDFRAPDSKINLEALRTAIGVR